MKILTVSVLVCAMMALTAAGFVPVPVPPSYGEHPGHDEPSNHVNDWTHRCPKGWTQFDFNCFLFVKEEKSWLNAEAHCHSFGGNLVPVVHIGNIDTHEGINQVLNDNAYFNGQIWVQDCEDQWMALFFGFFQSKRTPSCLQIGEGFHQITNPPTTVRKHRYPHYKKDSVHKGLHTKYGRNSRNQRDAPSGCFTKDDCKPELPYICSRIIM